MSMQRSLAPGLAVSARCLISALLCVLAGTAQSGGLLRAPWRAFDAGLFPHMAPSSMAAGDLDGDGDADLALGLYYYGAPGIAILKARGNGTYGLVKVYSTRNQRSVAGVAIADIDGDGDRDVVGTIPGADSNEHLLGVWRNPGNGNLSQPQFYSTGPGPNGLIVADFTGDGFPDVVTADFGFFGTGTTISLLAHNGLSGPAAGFLPRVAFEAGSAAELGQAGDLDNDGDLDLAVGRQTGNGPNHGIAVLLNQDGAGAFASPTLYDMGQGNSTRTSAVAVTDVDRDGKLDLIGAGSNSVGIRRGAGNGTFGALQVLAVGSFPFRAKTLSTGDLNGDLFPDIIAASPTGRAGDGFYLFLSDGAGGFRQGEFHEAAKQTYVALALDADGDSDLDVVTAANDSSVVTVHENRGTGVFLIPARNPAGAFTSGMDGADIDGDGDIDIVTADTAAHVLRNRGDGEFDLPFTVRTPGVNPNEVKLRDMNGDGALDILVSDELNSDFCVALNHGDGTFATGVETQMGGSQGGSVDAFDLDGDSDLDVAVSDEGPVPAIRLARNSGNGVSYSIPAALVFDAIPFGLGGGDFDHDGRVDLVTSGAFGLTVFPGRGNFTFKPMLPTGVNALGFVVSDLDQDGELDLVYQAGTLTGSTDWIGVMRGYGDGTFRFPAQYQGPIGLESPFQISADVDVADVSGDGRPDVILTSNAPNDLSIFRGQSDGTLAKQDRYGVGYSAFRSVVADFDGDRALDVASVIWLPPLGFGDAVVVLHGNGAPAR